MIGVFDSGIGGLTIMRELLRELPDCAFTYLGDTARTLAHSCRGMSRTFHFTDTTPHTACIASEWLGMPVEIEGTELSSMWYAGEERNPAR